MNLKLLKAITFGLGFLILLATGALIFGASRQAEKLGADKPGAGFAQAGLKELNGAAIKSMTSAEGRLFLHLSGNGPDRVLVLDAKSGAVLGVIGPESK